MKSPLMKETWEILVIVQVPRPWALFKLFCDSLSRVLNEIRLSERQSKEMLN